MEFTGGILMSIHCQEFRLDCFISIIKNNYTFQKIAHLKCYFGTSSLSAIIVSLLDSKGHSLALTITVKLVFLSYL